MIAYLYPPPPPPLYSQKRYLFFYLPYRSVCRLHQKTIDYLSQSEGLTLSSQIGYPYRLPMYRQSGFTCIAPVYRPNRNQGLRPVLCALFPTAQAMQRSVSLQRAVSRLESERLQEYQKWARPIVQPVMMLLRLQFQTYVLSENLRLSTKKTSPRAHGTTTENEKANKHRGMRDIART